MTLANNFVVAWAKATQVASVVRLTPFDDTTPAGRSKERYRRVALTSLAAIAARGIGVLTSLVSVPLTLHYLGTERYGLWMTISSTIAFLGFADLGLGNGLLSSVAEANGKDDAESARRCVSSAFFLLLAIALLILVGFVASYSFIPWPRVFNVTSDLAVKEVGPATAVLILGFVVNLPLGIVQRVQIGCQEGFKQHLWCAVGALFGLAGVLLAVCLQAGLPWLVLAMSGGPILAVGLNWIQVFGYSHRSLVPRLNLFNWKESRILARMGVLFFMLQILALLAMSSDNLVIAQVMGASAVAGYAVTQKLFVATQVAPLFIAPLWPAFAEALARKDYAWARLALNRSLLLSLGLCVMTATPLFFFGKGIIAIWAGPEVVPATFLLFGFSIWTLIAGYGACMSAFLNSTRELLAKQMWFYAATTIAALVLKVVLVRNWQAAGAIWATVFGYGLFFVVPTARVAYGYLNRWRL